MELDTEVAALRHKVRELAREKSSTGVQTATSDDMKGDDGTIRGVNGGSEVGQVEQVEPEQLQVTEHWAGES